MFIPSWIILAALRNHSRQSPSDLFTLPSRIWWWVAGGVCLLALMALGGCHDS